MILIEIFKIMVGLSLIYELSLYEFIYIIAILIHQLFSFFFGTHYSKSYDGNYLFKRLKIIPCFFFSKWHCMYGFRKRFF